MTGCAEHDSDGVRQQSIKDDSFDEDGSGEAPQTN